MINTRFSSASRSSASCSSSVASVIMRRHENYAESPASTYGAVQIQNSRSDFESQLEAFTPERDQPYSDSQAEGQWRWDRDAPNMSRPMATGICNEGQGADTSRTYYRGQMDPKSVTEKQGSDPRAQPQHQENQKPGYDNSSGMLQTFEGLEQKFMDDITRLAKDQIKAEDAEIARHREKINSINNQYKEQLATLRTQHTGKREEIMRKESQARQKQYKKQAMDQYHPNTSGSVNLMPSSHPQGYIGNAQDLMAVADAPSRSYGSARFEDHGERARFQGRKQRSQVRV